MCSQGERIWLGQPLTSLLLIYGFNTLHASKLLPRSSSLQTLPLSWSYPGSPFKLRCKAEKSVLNNHNLKHLMTKTSSEYLCLPSKILSYWLFSATYYNKAWILLSVAILVYTYTLHKEKKMLSLQSQRKECIWPSVAV